MEKKTQSKKSLIEEAQQDDEEERKYRENYKLCEEIIFNEFLNFLEVYIHSILYISEVYPKETFAEFKIYNLPFLKFNIDENVNKYITDFLSNIEDLLFSRIINKIYILIIDADTKYISEIYNTEITFPSRFYGDLNYEEFCLNFKSILYKLFITRPASKKLDKDEKEKYNVKDVKDVKDENYISTNKTFLLCLETKENKIITNNKLFDNIMKDFETNYIINLFENDMNQLFTNREVIGVLDEAHFSINISRNFI